MPPDELDRILLESAAEVLETMFFTSLTGATGAEAAGATCISAALDFRGNRSGRFGVHVQPECGRRIAASFLGLEQEEVSQSEVGEVVGELANMLCGSVLSRLEQEGRFELLRPEIVPPGTCCPQGDAAHRFFALETGTLAVCLDLERTL